MAHVPDQLAAHKAPSGSSTARRASERFYFPHTSSHNQRQTSQRRKLQVRNKEHFEGVDDEEEEKKGVGHYRDDEQVA